MTLKIVAQGDGYIVLDTNTRRIVGRHASKNKAMKQRRYLRKGKRSSK